MAGAGASGDLPDCAPAALAQDRGRAGCADWGAAFLAAEGGAAGGEPRGGGACVQPGHRAARPAGGEPGRWSLGLGGVATLRARTPGQSDFHPALQDKEKVSELEAVMEKQKKKVEGGMEMEVI